MKHAWKRHPDSETIRRPFERIRLCDNCGAEQTWETDYSWGRVERRYWYPKVGRCGKPKIKIRGKLGTHSTSLYIVVEPIREPPSVGDRIRVTSTMDYRAFKTIEVLVDAIKFGNYYYLSMR